MHIKVKAMGQYQTNCYIVSHKEKEIIIDPGVGATEWVLQNVRTPVAIFNTHGHFDHVWSDKELKELLKIPVFCPKDDVFMLEKDLFGQNVPLCSVDVAVEPDSKHTVGGLDVTFLHFPGHTPGCSAIEIEENWFCGDFLFKGSIGRVDFPYSDPQAMKKSLKKALNYPKNVTLLPGHGPKSTLEAEKRNIPYWIKAL